MMPAPTALSRVRPLGSGPSGGGDERFLLQAVSWEAYLFLSDVIGDAYPGTRMTYANGLLEIMSPSLDHEEYKTMIARLLEAFAEEHDVDLNGFGGAHFRSKAKRRGLQPDECYVLGRRKPVPDIAIEVVVSSPLMNKLLVYAALGVREVWVWEDGALRVYVLHGKAFRAAERSSLLPVLDVKQLSRYVTLGKSQTTLVKTYRRWIRAKKKRK